MKFKLIALLIILSLFACSHIDKESKSLVLYKKDHVKIGLAEKKSGVMAKVIITF